MEQSNQSELIVNMLLKFYDVTICVLLIILFLLNILMINEGLENYFYILLILVFIILIDIGFKSEIVPFILQLNNFMSERGKKVLSSLLKTLFYLLLLVVLIINPPGVPPNFLIPNLASIDFYFFVLVCTITGLYLDIGPILQLMVKTDNKMN